MDRTTKPDSSKNDSSNNSTNNNNDNINDKKGHFPENNNYMTNDEYIKLFYNSNNAGVNRNFKLNVFHGDNKSNKGK